MSQLLFPLNYKRILELSECVDGPGFTEAAKDKVDTVAVVVIDLHILKNNYRPQI